MNMQEFRFALEHQQREQQIVVDLMPQQYTKPSTPPPSPPMKGQCLNSVNIVFGHGVYTQVAHLRVYKNASVVSFSHFVQIKHLFRMHFFD